ncbi:MAG: cell division protease FtsH [Candidatus Dependentiae bacterium]|nr:cell division protease FtsH [Candidatus Dependentiae bacterium]
MSMQRSFSMLMALLLIPSSPAHPLILDEINEFFAIHVWSINDLAGNAPQNNNVPEQPQYEKELPDFPSDEKDDQPLPQNKPQIQRPRPEKSIVLKDSDIRFNNIVGQDEAVATLRGVVDQFKNPSRLRLLGGEHKKGILLAGPPGTGKTMLARAIANELGYSFHECSASSFVEVFVGTGAQRVRELFNAAHNAAPAVIFIDEIDAAASKRGEGSGGGDMEYTQTTIELLTQMNKLNHNTNVLVITATNCIEHVDEAFKAPHRFDVINIGLPSPKGRADTMRNYLNRLPRVEVSDEAIIKVVEKTRGFSQSQLKSLVNGAVQIAVNDKEATKVIDDHVLASLEQARNAMKISIFGSSSTEYDSVKFNDLAGLDDIVNEFRFLVYSLQYPDKLKEFGVNPPKGILLFGKPGTGKTMLVRALANEAHCKVISVSGGSFDTKYMGEGAKEIRKLFASADMVSPCVIFIDEIDAIKSEQSITALLTEMDGFVKQNAVVVIGATNHLEAVDYRLRREGRFDRIIPIMLPNEQGRREILKLYISKLPQVDQASVPYDTLAYYTENFSGAGLKNIVNDAAMYACIDNASMIQETHFQRALERAIQSRALRSQDD